MCRLCFVVLRFDSASEAHHVASVVMRSTSSQLVEDCRDLTTMTMMQGIVLSKWLFCVCTVLLERASLRMRRSAFNVKNSRVK